MTAPRLPTALADRYRVEHELGRGGMGAVYLATDVRLDRQVALKVLPPEFAADSALRDRFLRETRTAASFSHPNIVPVHAVEEDGNGLAFVMGLVEGESLAALVARRGRLDARAVVRLLQDVAYALAYAHGRGVVHRDIKPDNIMIERATGRALVMDFGIARAITPRSDAPGLTRVGEVVGTPEYMSPEQAAGDNVDGRSDLYSLGLVALFALTGQAPITGTSAQQVIVRQLTERLPPAATLRPDLPPALCEAIDRCVAKEPSARFPSAEALVEAIDTAQLAAPEIPLAVRLFAQEAGTLGLIVVFMGFISWMLVTAIARRLDGIDAYLPVVVLAGVVVTRIFQVRVQAARLAAAGFSLADVLGGMARVMDERATMRAALATDPVVHARRRRTVIVALLQFPLAALLFKLALDGRVQIGPQAYQSGIGATTMLVTALVLVGVSIVLLLRSPFRATIGERMFHTIWLGSVGRWFIGSAMRHGGVASVASGAALRGAVASGASASKTPAGAGAVNGAMATVRATTRPAQRTESVAPSTDDRLARIEARLASIERAVTTGARP